MMSLDEVDTACKQRKPAVSRTVLLIVMVIAVALIAVFEFGNLKLTDNELHNDFYKNIITRVAGAAVFLVLVAYEGYYVLNPIRKPFLFSVLITLPALAVAVNNFPFIPLLTGKAAMTLSGMDIFLCGVESVSIGLFEEAAFRGILLLMLCQKRRKTTKDLFLSILIASALFGLIHLVNIAAGSNPFAVIRQIGYSTLIGAMCSVVLFKTANLWLCALLHAVFNFGGRIFDLCGCQWDVPTTVLTAGLAVVVAVYMVIVFLKTKPAELDRIYDNSEAT